MSNLLTNKEIFDELFRLRDSKYEKSNDIISLVGVTNYLNRHYASKIKAFNEASSNVLTEELSKKVDIKINKFFVVDDNIYIYIKYKIDGKENNVLLKESKDDGDFIIDTQKDSRYDDYVRDNRKLAEDSKVLSVISNEIFSLFERNNVYKYLDLGRVNDDFSSLRLNSVNSSFDANIDLQNVSASTNPAYNHNSLENFDGKLMIYSDTFDNTYGFLSDSLRISQTVNILEPKKILSKINIRISDMPLSSQENLIHERKRELDRISRGDYYYISDIKVKKKGKLF